MTTRKYTTNPETRVALFQRKEVRRVIHNNEWWFVITDVIAALTDSVAPHGYLKDMRRRDQELAKGWGQIATPLSVVTPGGPQNLNCANTEGIFRIIQSIPSAKAEPFKRWLAKVGYERIQEIEDPELGTRRTRALYKAKGYPDDWIEKRMRSIAIRDELTAEWENRGVGEHREYAILTAEISKAAFGVTPSEYAELKGLKRENLRDHMNDLELIFSMLGEASTTENHPNKRCTGVLKKQTGGSRGWHRGRQRPARPRREERPQGRDQRQLSRADSAGQKSQTTARQSVDQEIQEALTMRS